MVVERITSSQLKSSNPPRLFFFYLVEPASLLLLSLRIETAFKIHAPSSHRSQYGRRNPPAHVVVGAGTGTGFGTGTGTGTASKRDSRATHLHNLNRAREVTIHELRRQSRNLAPLAPPWKDNGILITVSVAQESEDISDLDRLSPTTESSVTATSLSHSQPTSPVWPVAEPPPWGDPPGSSGTDHQQQHQHTKQRKELSEKSRPGYAWSIGPGVADNKIPEKIVKVPRLSRPPPRRKSDRNAADTKSLRSIPEKAALRLSDVPKLAGLTPHSRSRSRSPVSQRPLPRSRSVSSRIPVPITRSLELDSSNSSSEQLPQPLQPGEKKVAHSFDRPVQRAPSKRELPASYAANMASRGARARKVTEKNIQKEEKKHIEKDRQERFARLHSPTGTVSSGSYASRPFSSGDKQHATPWTKTMSPVQSSAASVTSTGSNGSAFSSVLGSRLSSIDERKKYTAKGKSTSHPRGRGGGVPVKLKNFDDSRSKSSFSNSFEARSNKSRSHSVSSDNARPSFEKSWAHTRLYVGGGQPARPYSGFEHDDDMWMADGDCLIFFSEETSEDDPRPMLRVHKGVLEQARSTFMINLLRYGEIVHEDQDTPPSSAGPASPVQSQWPLTPKSLGHLDQVLSENTSRMNLQSPRVPPEPKANSDRDTWSTSDQTLFSPGDRERPRTAAGSQKTPLSVAGTALQSPAESLYGDQHDDGAIEITHEIWFRAPSHIKRPDIQRRHHMATRNYIALLYGLPLVGNDFYEMLSDLQNVMDTYYELNEPSERWNSAQVIVQYLTQRKLDDIRGNLSMALGLLTWSEQPNVLWDAGYLEAFVHCVGMMTQATMKTKEYRNLSQVTRHKLQMAYNGSQLRLIEAEERLSRFDFPEMWYVDGVAGNGATQKSFESFREFLFGFYEEEFGRWPPQEEDHQGHWLSRATMARLQADFGAVYNYWVDRDIIWDGNENRPSRKWEMIPKRLRAGGFEADSPGFPITDMLIGFDSSQKYDHVPHPFPLLPETRLPSPKLQSTRKQIFSKFRSKDKEVVPDVKQQYQMALAYNQASNINRMGTTTEDNKLLDTISGYEKSATTSTMTAPEARLGRWVLLYGILQVLSTISVDTAGLKYKDKVRYYIGPSLEGCPPWRSPDAAPLMIEACQQRSFCWLAPQTWTESRGHQGPGSPPGYSNHQYELTEPVSTTPDLGDASSQVSAGIHRNPSILQTMSASAASPGGSSRSNTPRGTHSQSNLRGPALMPARGSPLASPSLMGSPLGSALATPQDAKNEYELLMRGNGTHTHSPATHSPLVEDPRRMSPPPTTVAAHRGPSPMSPLTLDGVASARSSGNSPHMPSLNTPHNRSPEINPLLDRDDGPPQLGELSFGRGNEF